MAEILHTISEKYFPFKTEYDLRPVLDYWRSSHILENEALDNLEEYLEHNDFLLEPNYNGQEWADHNSFLESLFKPFFAFSKLDNSVVAITCPFLYKEYLLATPAYKELLTGSTKKENDAFSDFGESNIQLIYAYKIILKKIYNIDLQVDFPIIVPLYDIANNLWRYFKVALNNEMIQVKTNKKSALNEHKLQKLLDKPFDEKAWAKLLPPANFTFSGVSVVTLLEVTIEESTNRIRRLLLNTNYANGAAWLESLQQEMRNLFKLPQLRVGIGTLMANGAINFVSSRPLWNSLLISQIYKYIQNWKENSFYTQLLKKGKTIIIEDLKDWTKETTYLNQALIDLGYRNLLITPLFKDDKIIGILELACPIPGAINGLSMLKINQIKPIFVNAIQRHLEEFENRVETVMLEQYTAIHPTIRWKFREAAIQILEKGRNTESEAIVFENLHPFYGSLDIRNSSNRRNHAVLRDLYDNLEICSSLLRKTHQVLSLSILGELVYELEQQLELLRQDYTKGDETELVDFIRKKLNPIIDHLSNQYPQIRDDIEDYKAKICPDSGIFTKHRLAYDQQLLNVNQCIVDCLEEEENTLQQLLPCLFEKYQTDGVEYNIYLGASLSQKNTFDKLHIDNLRLRQLIWTCKIVRRITQIENTNCIDSHNENSFQNLEIAPVILAYGTPVTLKFRREEKKLDVDGSYNVRYEILKKRIDKSYILNSNERLSQPGHIAVVYMHDEEESAYSRHLNYLAFQGLIDLDWVTLDLEALPGVEGLKAMRAKVKLDDV